MESAKPSSEQMARLRQFFGHEFAPLLEELTDDDSAWVAREAKHSDRDRFILAVLRSRHQHAIEKSATYRHMGDCIHMWSSHVCSSPVAHGLSPPD